MAGPYPLPTLACTIGATGISAPAYNDILQSLIASFQGIYGADVYLTPDTQDYQLLAIFAAAINDSNNATIAAYLAYSPSTAQGAGLASQVKINGLQKLTPSNSTADLTVVGQAGKQITGGLVGDAFGNQWALPASVIIPVSGSIVETATCQTPGAIQAAPGSINKILNPVQGWQSASNAASAVPGNPTEDDAQLRQRQSVSTAGPAQTVNAAIIAAIENLAGVTAVMLYENPTGSADANGVPAHSIAVVVEGGDAVQIATAIANRKTPGTGTAGTTTEVITDSKGVTNTINFYRPTVVRVLAEIDITALTGYVSTTGTSLVAAVAAYVSGLPIGGDVYNSKVAAQAVLLDGTLSTTFNLTATKLARNPSSPAVQDLVIAFNELASLAVADVTLVTS